jgi:hypothetical protein
MNMSLLLAIGAGKRKRECSMLQLLVSYLILLLASFFFCSHVIDVRAKGLSLWLPINAVISKLISPSSGSAVVSVTCYLVVVVSQSVCLY